MKDNNTSWGESAKWYSNYMEETENSYQKQVILPGLLKQLALKGGERVLDIACGQGFFARELAKVGAKVEGADISPELIAEAKSFGNDIAYHVAPAHELKFAESGAYDVATIILATQNIEDMKATFAEVSRVLRVGGRLILVLMHPAFRIPKFASWGWDEVARVQYRRVDRYLSEDRSELLVHPGQKESPVTISFHRPVRGFAQALFANHFAVTGLDEWISHKKSQSGPRRVAEDRSRVEIPLFMMIEATKLG